MIVDLKKQVPSLQVLELQREFPFESGVDQTQEGRGPSLLTCLAISTAASEGCLSFQGRQVWSKHVPSYTKKLPEQQLPPSFLPWITSSCRLHFHL